MPPLKGFAAVLALFLLTGTLEAADTLGTLLGSSSQPSAAPTPSSNDSDSNPFGPGSSQTSANDNSKAAKDNPAGPKAATQLPSDDSDSNPFGPSPSQTSTVSADEDSQAVPINRAGLGAQIQSLNAKTAKKSGLSSTQGVLVKGVSSGSAAEKAGLKKGDVILEVAGEPVADMPNLLAKLHPYEPGQEVQLTVLRKGARSHFTVTLQKLDEAFARRGAGVIFNEKGWKAQQAGNMEQAFQDYQQSADLGNPTGEQLLGWCYWNGHGVKKNIFKAMEWFQKSEDQGDPGGEYGVGCVYFYGPEKDYDEALKRFQKLAEQGDAWGEFGLGQCYFFGQGAAKDQAEAVKWYQKSADQGNSYGELAMGNCYKSGTGVPRDLGQARHWLQMSADQKNDQALKALEDLGN